MVVIVTQVTIIRDATPFPLLLMLLLLLLLLTQRCPTDPVGAAVVEAGRLNRRGDGRRVDAAVAAVRLLQLLMPMVGRLNRRVNGRRGEVLL